MKNFKTWFESVTEEPDQPIRSPHPWQLELASRSQCDSQLIRIPTGLGKTLGVLLAWGFHRLERNDDLWPRRLIWCLPMRTLVEQIFEEARKILKNAGLESDVSLNMLMGGVDQADWHYSPEKPAILIGTQDMLLSRALNRGYAAARARWPIDYGLLNHDALWVMDEVQLMDVGLATSAQLQAFRDSDAQRALRPCVTWWMSATLQPDWLRTVDTEGFHANWTNDICSIPPSNRTSGLWEVRKTCATQTIDIKKTNDFVTSIEESHKKSLAGEHGRITLVVCNTVDRAVDTYNALVKNGHTEGIELVHSRFRPAERESWRERFLSRETCKFDVDRIIVATQVVEAGVDISATCLVTELAPWPSLVQRFGRCARYGGNGTVIVVDRGHDDKSCSPYTTEELEVAWNAIQSLKDVSVKAIEEFEYGLSPDSRASLYPYSPAHLLLRTEFDELFDTTPDLTGADLDISRFIRSGEERDLQVFWLRLESDVEPPNNYQPHRRELCSVPFLKARDWLCGSETKINRKPKLKPKLRAWIWDWIDGTWYAPRRENMLPGRVICVDANCGGYQKSTGFDPDSKAAVLPVELVQLIAEPALRSDYQQSSEALSINIGWKTIACHSHEVANELETIARSVGLSDELRHVLNLVAIWHDIGKSHPAFQGLLEHSERPERLDLAKGPKGAWKKPPVRYEYAIESKPISGFSYSLSLGTPRERAGVSGPQASAPQPPPPSPLVRGEGSKVLSNPRLGSSESRGAEGRKSSWMESRPGFRHELASALAMFALLEKYQPNHSALLGKWAEAFGEIGLPINTVVSTIPVPTSVQSLLDCTPEQFDLLIYLIASHHGKVRGALLASPSDQDYRDRDHRGLPIRGVREDDQLPAIEVNATGEKTPELTLTLEPARLGLSTRTGASWRERGLELVAQHGPTTLAYLESIFRAADVRASKLETPDSALQLEPMR